MGIATLVITDGSTIVDLLAAGYGFHLADWPQAITGYKGGGTIQDSPLAGGRRLVDKKFTDGIETFTLRVNATNQDALADDMQDLLRLLEQATDYWSGWYDTPIYLEVKWNNETNTRYAIIKNYQLSNLTNPFGQPFLQANCEAIYDEITLVVERGAWLSNVPGEATATTAAASESYDGRTLGNVNSSGTVVPVTTADVYIANKDNRANLTDIYNYDDSLTAFSANLMDAALPFTLFPGSPAANDIVYFGIDTGVTDSGPFSSLVLDIGTAAAYSATLTWEYWNGAWTALTVLAITSADAEQSGTDYFTATGVMSISWKQASDWAATAINGVTAFWVRVRISAFTSWTTNPTQQNRDIYSVTWPYARITSDQVAGDLPALMTLLFNQRNGNLEQGGIKLGADRVIVGLRSESRGTLFTAYLNCSDEQNTVGSVTVGNATTFENDLLAPAGRRMHYNPTGVDAMAMRARIAIGAGTADEYYGTYRVFVRATQTGGAVGDILVRLGLRAGGFTSNYFDTKSVAFNELDVIELLDLGQITLPGFPIPISEATSITFHIQASAASGTPSLYLYDLILIPTDEWSGEFLNPLAGVQSDTGLQEQNLQVDSIAYPKYNLRSLVRPTSAPATVSVQWQPITNGPAILQANANQRLWFLSARRQSSESTAWTCDPEMLSTVQITRVQRYFSARGDR